MKKKILVPNNNSLTHKASVQSLLEKLDGITILERFPNCFTIQCTTEVYAILDDLCSYGYFIMTD